jgi:hypothetical protein
MKTTISSILNRHELSHDGVLLARESFRGNPDLTPSRDSEAKPCSFWSRGELSYETTRRRGADVEMV